MAGRDYEFDEIDLSRDFDRRTRSGGSGNRRRRKKRKKKSRGILHVILPPFIAIVLIAVVVVVAIKTGLFEGFTYSTKQEDLYAWFNIDNNDSAVLIVDGEPSEGRIVVRDGALYFPLSVVKAVYTDRFYLEETENRLIYTREEGNISTVVGTKSYEYGTQSVSEAYDITRYEGEGDAREIYIALDYLKLFVNMEVILAGGNDEPYRAMIKTAWGEKNIAPVEKEHMLRSGPDKKNGILTKLSAGDTVTMIEEGSEFSKVMTEDLITGYAETRYLGSVRTETETPVTTALEEQHTSFTSEEPVVLMWHSIAGIAGNDSLSSAIAGTKGIKVISPTWFSVMGVDGSVRSFATHDYVDLAHQNGMKVWAAVDDFNSDYTTSLYDILVNPETRKKIISSLITYALDYQIDGINVDFERVTADSGEVYIQFIRELCIECHKNNLVVSVDNYVPKTYNTFYHRKEQGVFADYVIIMGYDETYAGSEKAGSVASIGFVREGIEETLKEVPANKVINAVPFYTRVWEEEPLPGQVEDVGSENGGVDYTLSLLATPSMKQQEELLANYGASPVWDETAMQNYATWTSGGKKYEVWLEDAASLTAKLEFMKAFELGGVAGWEITLAADYVWDIIGNYY